MSGITLTEKGQKAMLMLKSKRDALAPTYGPNTFDRVVFEHGNIPASMILYSIGQPSDDDIDDMIRQGYATRP